MFDQNLENKIFFIGTMHVDRDGALNVQKEIRRLKPDIVMVELDTMRMEELRRHEMQPRIPPQKSSSQPPQSAPPPTPGNDFLGQMQNFQEQIGNIMGVMPGREMLAAIDVAKAYGIPVAYIDRPILETMQRLQAVGNELDQEQEDLIDSMADPKMGAPDLRSMLNDIKTPDKVRELLQNFKKDYPQLYKVLIEERNEYMAERIALYSRKYPSQRIVVIIGGGHVEEMVKLTKNQLAN